VRNKLPFSTRVQTRSGTNPTSHDVKWPVREDDHLSVFHTMVKYERRCTFSTAMCPHGVRSVGKNLVNHRWHKALHQICVDISRHLHGWTSRCRTYLWFRCSCYFTSSAAVNLWPQLSSATKVFPWHLTPRVVTEITLWRMAVALAAILDTDYALLPICCTRRPNAFLQPLSCAITKKQVTDHPHSS